MRGSILSATARCPGVRHAKRDPSCASTAMAHRDEGNDACDLIPVVRRQCRILSDECKRTRPPSKQYVQALLARIQSLEEALSSQAGSAAESTIDPPKGEVQHSPPPAALPPTASDAASPIHTLIDAITPSPGRLHVSDTGQLRFFYSRNHQLLSSDAVASPSDAQKRGYAAARRLTGVADVPQDLRDHLLDLFWCWQNSWHYLVPEKAFLHDLHREHSGRFCSPLLLLAIFSVTSRLSDRPEVRLDVDDPDTAGEAYANEAKVMLNCEFESPTTMTVQAAALLAVREMALDMESSGWVYSGIATRMAFNLGLHLDCSDAVTRGVISCDEAEARSITWWGCYMIDRMFSVGWGRPATIPYRSITVEKPSLYGETEHREWRPIPRAVSDVVIRTSYGVTNFHYVLELFGIMSKILEQDPADICTARISAPVRSALFTTSLRVVTEAETRSNSLQYHTAVVLLHRPFFQMFRQDFPLKGQDTGPHDIHIQACRTSAEWISNIIRIYKVNYTLRRIPIFAVHCTVTAATVHLADTMSADAELRKKAIQRLQVCVLGLREMSTAWNSGTRCILSIQRLANECNAGAEALNATEAVSESEGS
ncbi:Fungal trans [Geosmithia morbida]|uniref:Fungal trans n=1 Tax=Geosmithia morbida TaxID=1094350 RepID=A0A9P4YXG2_9HYPO|nr:Fungal trans [Geosmithia morbida]KAF4124302.1 Fungal trans [Geosmithia morbida]